MSRRAVYLAAICWMAWTPVAPGAAATDRPGDPVAGATLAEGCAGCHAMEEGARQRWGPSLVGVLDRPVGSEGGYRYGSFLASRREAGDTWTEPMLRAWLVDSKGMARAADERTKMPSQKLTPAELDDLLSHLRGAR
ncbi:MAG: c-type cytochrome [Myxococcales bacterium]|nr:c-type cytochrome [Myxococcales bacterium]